MEHACATFACERNQTDTSFKYLTVLFDASLLVTTRYLRKKVQFSLGNQFSSNVKYFKFGSSFGSVRMQMLRKHVLLCNPPTRSDCHQGQPGVIPRHLLGRV